MRTCVGDYELALDRVEYAACRADAGIGTVLATIAPLVGEETCLLHPANGLLEQPIGELAAVLEDPGDLVLFALPQSEDPSVRDLPIMGARADTRHGRVIDAIGLFGPAALARAVERLPRSGGADLAAAARLLVCDGVPVRVHAVSSWHHYRGHGSICSR